MCISIHDNTKRLLCNFNSSDIFRIQHMRFLITFYSIFNLNGESIVVQFVSSLEILFHSMNMVLCKCRHSASTSLSHFFFFSFYVSIEWCPIVKVETHTSLTSIKIPIRMASPRPKKQQKHRQNHTERIHSTNIEHLFAILWNTLHYVCNAIAKWYEFTIYRRNHGHLCVIGWYKIVFELISFLLYSIQLNVKKKNVFNCVYSPVSPSPCSTMQQ